MKTHDLSPNMPEPSAISRKRTAVSTDAYQSIYLEGKCLELVSLYLDAMSADKEKNRMLTKSDMEKIHAARKILVNNLFDPPTIQNLSTLCGSNEYKLKRGFQICFGDSIRGILRKERMYYANDLLRNTDTSVNIVSVSNAVGYSNTGHFIAAFRREFGITPGQILKKARRNLP
ncbi:MAG: AraC family transcriptional regulator [Deltaproteobacteria bacterium]|nr:AraC family transcriptional regulator [Deltaproteobacteria bacterium]